MRGFQVIILSALAAVGVEAVVTEDIVAVDRLVEARQAPGTPQFECHSDCGNALAGSRIANHCDNSTWVGLYEDCLDCALQFNIWRHYGNGLGNAGSACGLAATPRPSGVASSAPIPSSETLPAPEATSSTATTTSSVDSGVAATGTGLPSSFTSPGSASSTTPVPGNAAGVRSPSFLLFGSVVAIAIRVSSSW
ncbi:hypothetical protein QBC35DRAFT_462299 [Podospora australis]|uniref:Uncharacterized protein n=1 Tax=Podospora australis TaxID=1536484 RepID=A0AAN7AHT2_9PEZI|nr:hypothetical protein QBC35DRAFT_462299 [Podospora australis]